MKYQVNFKSVVNHVLFFSFFLFSCSSTRFPNDGPVDVPEDCFGIVHSSEYGIMDEMGAVWTLRTFSWGAIEKEKGHFNFSGYDEYVEEARNAGKKVGATLGYSNDWLYPEGKGKRYISPENIPHFLDFIEEIVKHYKGKIDVWNVWNEPNIKRFWDGPDKDFFELSRRTAQKIRETDPDAYIIGGSYVRVPKRYIKKMHKAGGMNCFDGLAFHPYARNPQGAMRLYDKLEKIMSDINFKGPVWITEIGHPTGGLYPHKTTLEKFPTYVVKELCGVAARGARVTLWYQLFDRYNEGEVPPSKFTLMESEKYFGLLYPNHKRKDGANAYALCGKFLPGSRYTPDYLQREKIPSSIVSVCFLEGKSGNNTLVLWNDRNRAKKATLYLDAPAMLYDISTGEGRPLSAAATLEIGAKPLMITWQGTAVPRLSTKK